jgi:trehalose utilization protein
VLLWWGHKIHGQVSDAIVERVQKRGWEGMGLIVLHSGHFSKIFRKLMGTPCSLKWREAGEVERLWVINHNHPIAAGLGEYIEIEHEEMYGEPFTIPEPLETIFVSWFEGGEVFRSGVTFQRGAGKFLFPPRPRGLPTYYNKQVLQVPERHALKHNPQSLDTSMTRPTCLYDKAPVRLQVKGPGFMRKAGGIPLMPKLRILILGTGGMAKQHVLLLREDARVEITGAADVDLGRAKAFAEAHQIPNAFGTLEDAIAWGQFDAP